MNALAHVAAGVVGAVLVWAGARKAVDRRAWTTSAAAQGLPAVVAWAVPPVELVLGAALVGLGPEVWSLAAATVLLLVFTAFLAVQVMTGSAVPCACFGASMSRPPRWRDVGRNAAMIALLVVSAALA